MFNDLLKLYKSSIILILIINLQENQRTTFEYLNLNEKDHSVVSKNL